MYKIMERCFDPLVCGVARDFSLIMDSEDIRRRLSLSQQRQDHGSGSARRAPQHLPCETFAPARIREQAVNDKPVAAAISAVRITTTSPKKF
jgi:hypothetical protein